MSEEEIIIIRRTNAIRTLRTIASSNAGTLEESEAGELRETAYVIEGGTRPSLLRQMWTLMILRRYLFG